jgi:hypothetical protein
MSFQELASSARAAPHHPKTQATAQSAVECDRPDCIRAGISSHSPIINLLTSASDLSPDRQKDSL